MGAAVKSAARRLFSVKEYHDMARAGILTEDDRVELIEGEIVRRSPIGSRHAACVDRLNRRFTSGRSRRAVVRVQNPVRLSNKSEPQPDLALVRPRPDFYASAHPGPSDILLIIEVAEKAQSDRALKLPLYARAGIPEVWLVDLAAGAVEVFRNPSPGGYRSVRTARRGEVIAPAAFPGLKTAVDDILG